MYSRVCMYYITVHDIACVYGMVLTIEMVLCQLKRQHGVWCSRWCWKDSRLEEDLHLCDSIACGAFPPFFNPPPPIPPNILCNCNKEWEKRHFISGKAPIGLSNNNIFWWRGASMSLVTLTFHTQPNIIPFTQSNNGYFSCTVQWAKNMSIPLNFGILTNPFKPLYPPVSGLHAFGTAMAMPPLFIK